MGVPAPDELLVEAEDGLLSPLTFLTTAGMFNKDEQPPGVSMEGVRAWS